MGVVRARLQGVSSGDQEDARKREQEEAARREQERKQKEEEEEKERERTEQEERERAMKLQKEEEEKKKKSARRFVPYSVLRNALARPAQLDVTRLEVYLSPEEFKSVFKTTPDEFRKWPDWKQKETKKKVGLF